MVVRHDVLRTAMVWKELDEPVQVVLRQANCRGGGSQLACRLLAADDLAARFDPRTTVSTSARRRCCGPSRPMTGRGTAGCWLLLTHHLILDHTSMEILVHELRTLMANPQAPLCRLLPYRNFIAPTRSGVTRERARGFLHSHVGDVEEPTAPFGVVDMQAKRAKPPKAACRLDAALAHACASKARALGVTPASLFHLAWAAVLGAGLRQIRRRVRHCALRTHAQPARAQTAWWACSSTRCRSGSTSMKPGWPTASSRTHRLLARADGPRACAANTGAALQRRTRARAALLLAVQLSL